LPLCGGGMLYQAGLSAHKLGQLVRPHSVAAATLRMNGPPQQGLASGQLPRPQYSFAQGSAARYAPSLALKRALKLSVLGWMSVLDVLDCSTIVQLSDPPEATTQILRCNMAHPMWDYSTIPAAFTFD